MPDTEINAELVIYRLDKMEAMMAEHNRSHEAHMNDILNLFKGLDEKYSGKWVERPVIAVGAMILLAFVSAMIGLVFVPQVKAFIF